MKRILQTLCLTALTAALLLVYGCSPADTKKETSSMTSGTNSTASGLTVENEGLYIKDLYTDKSRYLPGDDVAISLVLENPTSEAKTISGALDVLSGADKVTTLSYSEAFAAKESKTLSLHWTAPAQDLTGYLLQATVVEQGKISDLRCSAADVSSDWKKFPRYGYLSDFTADALKSSTDVVENLSRYHISGLQFYDWQWSHDQPLAGSVSAPAASWPDIANRQNQAETVKAYLAAAKQKNMFTGSYNLMFGALKDYEQRGVSKSWGLYQDAAHKAQDAHDLPEDWQSDIFLMNPANKNWQQYLTKRVSDSLAVYPFDLFHIDTLGNRGTRYDYNGKEIKLDDAYSSFLTYMDKHLSVPYIMNAVDGYGQTQAAASNAAFNYVECWNNHETFASLRRVIEQNEAISKKTTIIAAYVNSGVADKEHKTFNETDVKLAEATILASGGYHLALGDSGMLSSEYFPAQSLKMGESLKTDLRAYCSFAVAYENLLRDGTAAASYKISSPDTGITDKGTNGTVWGFARENQKAVTLQLINLLTKRDSLWRDNNGNAPAPRALRDITVSVTLNSATEIRRVYAASPDACFGAPQELTFTREGDKLTVTLPSLDYWSMIVLEKS